MTKRKRRNAIRGLARNGGLKNGLPLLIMSTAPQAVMGTPLAVVGNTAGAVVGATASMSSVVAIAAIVFTYHGVTRVPEIADEVQHGVQLTIEETSRGMITIIRDSWKVVYTFLIAILMYLGFRLVQGVVAWVPTYTRPPATSAALMRARAVSEPRTRVVQRAEDTAGATRSSTLVQERTARIVNEAHPHRAERPHRSLQYVPSASTSRRTAEGNARSRAQSAPWVQARLETTWPSEVIRPTEAAAIRQSSQELSAIMHNEVAQHLQSRGWQVRGQPAPQRLQIKDKEPEGEPPVKKAKAKAPAPTRPPSKGEFVPSHAAGSVGVSEVLAHSRAFVKDNQAAFQAKGKPFSEEGTARSKQTAEMVARSRAFVKESREAHRTSQLHPSQLQTVRPFLINTFWHLQYKETPEWEEPNIHSDLRTHRVYSIRPK